jgi:rsbT co-antagonist protein RsbR
MGLLPWLTPPEVKYEQALAVLQIVDEAYFTAIFAMTDEYVHKLHQTVLDRRQELEQELAELSAKRLREHEEAMRIIRTQEDALHQVSLPILRVWDGVLVMPIIGELTEARAAALMERMLGAVVRERAHLAILDITALQMRGEQTAALLIRTMEAIKLLGARGMIVGMSAEVAAAMARWQLDLSKVRTYSTLADGLQAVQRESATATEATPRRGGS